MDDFIPVRSLISNLGWVKISMFFGVLSLVFIGIFVGSKQNQTDIIRPIPSESQLNAAKSILVTATPFGKATNKEEVGLQVIEPKDWSIAKSSNIRVSGKTVPEADVFIQNKRFQADAEGSFQLLQTLEVGINYIAVAVSNAEGKLSEKEIIVRYEPTGENLPENERTIFSSLGVITRRDGASTPNMVFDVESNSRRFKVQLANNTKLRNKFGGEPTLNEIRSGHMLAIYGKWKDLTQSVLESLLLRDTSNESRYTVRAGSVIAFLENTWTLDSLHRDTQTINIQRSTKFIDRSGETIDKLDIKTGDYVRIYGLWNPDSNTMTDVKEVKYYSLL